MCWEKYYCCCVVYKDRSNLSSKKAAQVEASSYLLKNLYNLLSMPIMTIIPFGTHLVPSHEKVLLGFANDVLVSTQSKNKHFRGKK